MLWKSLCCVVVSERWTDPRSREFAGDVELIGLPAGLRRDFDRRLALVEIDSLGCPDVGPIGRRACARCIESRFGVLMKYEYTMAFDSEGRKICGYHQSAGARQTRLQAEARMKRGAQWGNVWRMLGQWSDDPDSVDWEGFIHPSIHAARP